MINSKLRALYYVALHNGACTVVRNDDDADDVIEEVLNDVMTNEQEEWTDLVLAGLMEKMHDE